MYAKLFELITDVDLLRIQIIPSNQKFPIAESPCKMYENIPLVWHKYFVRVAKLYGIQLRYRKENAYFNARRKVICLGYKHLKDKQSIYLIKVFAHELAHALQHGLLFSVLGYYPERNNIFPTFEHNLKFERAAERLAYYICKELDDTIYWHHAMFSAYRKKADVSFLQAFYKKYT